MISSCCNSELLYIVGGKFKIDSKNEKELNNMPQGKTYYFECGKCQKPCDITIADIPQEI